MNWLFVPVIVTGYVVPHGALAVASMVTVDVAPADDTKGFVLLNETTKKEGAEYVRGTCPLKAPVLVRVSTDEPELLLGRVSDVELAVMLKSG